MKFKEIYNIARNNKKGRRKIGKILGMIFFLSLFVYFLINSIVSSVDRTIQLIKESPISRNIIFKDEDGTLFEQLKEACEDMEHVSDVYPYVQNLHVEVEGIKENEIIDLTLESSSDNYTDYLVEGTLPKENEILLPQYLYAMENGDYTDGSQYIGKKIKVIVVDWIGKETEFEYIVSGTYDNIYAAIGMEIAFVIPETAVALYEVSMEGAEIALENDMATYGDYDRSHYTGYDKEYYYAVVLDSRENLEDVRNQISETAGIHGFTEVLFEGDGMPTVLTFVQLICMGITIILLIVVIVLLVIIIGNDIHRRRKEMAMYLVHGYTRKNLIQIVGMEYSIRFAPILIYSGITVAAILMIINLVIDNLFPIEYQMMRMALPLGTFCIGAVILGIVLGVALYTISEQLKKIELLKEIKVEG